MHVQCVIYMIQMEIYFFIYIRQNCTNKNYKVFAKSLEQNKSLETNKHCPIFCCVGCMFVFIPVSSLGSWRPGTGHTWQLLFATYCSRKARSGQCRWNPSSYQLAAGPGSGPLLHAPHLPPPTILWKTDQDLWRGRNEKLPWFPQQQTL